MNSFWTSKPPALKVMSLGYFLFGLGAETSIVVITKTIAKWFKGGWGDIIESTLADLDEDIFNKKFVQRLLREQRMGLNNTKRLFTLMMFELWRRKYLN